MAEQQNIKLLKEKVLEFLNKFKTLMLSVHGVEITWNIIHGNAQNTFGVVVRGNGRSLGQCHFHSEDNLLVFIDFLETIFLNKVSGFLCCCQ